MLLIVLGGGEFREVHENEWVGLVNHMLRFIADALKLPGLPALLQFVRSNQCSFLGEPKLEMTLCEKPVAADAHCHIDLLLQKMRVTCYDDAFVKFTFPDMDMNMNIIIPCYAFPNMFPVRAQLDQLPPSAWNFAVSFHPWSVEYEYPGYMAQFRALARMERQWP